jgi:hypothetical protein
MIFLKESFVDTCEKVSVKAISSFCVNPLATSCALYLSTLPYESFLVLNIHLQPIGFTPSGKKTISQTLLSYIDFISSSICENSHFLNPDGK